MAGKINLDEIHESDKSDSIPTNEGIIDELTKNLESSHVKDMGVGDNYSVPSQVQDTSNNLPHNNELDFEIPEEFDKKLDKPNDEPSPTRNEYFIDEIVLMDAETQYTDEDKERLQKESLKHKLEGNKLFQGGQYEESIRLYTLALRTCPLAFPNERAILFSNRAAAMMKLGLKECAVEDCSKAVELNETYWKPFFRRAQLNEDLDKLDAALLDYRKVLELDPLHREALHACKRLPDQIAERNEKLKTEMLGKLKDLGNLILRPFGLSTDNFQMQQDPNTGGYSVNFQQNSK